MTAVESWINCEHVSLTNTLEKLTCRVLRILEFIDQHRAAIISQFTSQIILISDLTSLEIVIHHSILIILIDKEHA